MRNDSNINLRLPSDLRAALDAMASRVSEDTGIEVTPSDLLRVGAQRLLASPEPLFRSGAHG
jgi:hypothetical protein